jgi:hypothetical protein
MEERRKYAQEIRDGDDFVDDFMLQIYFILKFL